MGKKPYYVTATLAAVMFFLSCLVGQIALAANYKLATNVNEESVAGTQIAMLVKSIDERTGGRVKFKVFANSVLGDQMQYFQQIQKGVIEAGLINSAALENVIPALGVINLPYIFRTSEEYGQVMAHPELKKLLNESADKHNFIPLGFIASGYRSIYTTKPIRSAAELAGLKLRSLSSETYIEMLKLFGAVPTPMAFGELYSAMQMGVVDGAEGGLAGLYEVKFGEVAKYAIRSEQTRLTDFVIISKKFKDRLSPSDMAIVQDAFNKLSAASVAVSDEREAEGAELAAKEMGVTFFDIDKTPLMNAVEPMYDTAMENADKAALLKIIFEIEGRQL